YCWAHVEDTARAHILAMERGRAGETYIIAGMPHTLIEVFELAERITGIPAPRFHASPVCSGPSPPCRAPSVSEMSRAGPTWGTTRRPAGSTDSTRGLWRMACARRCNMRCVCSESVSRRGDLRCEESLK